MWTKQINFRIPRHLEYKSVLGKLVNILLCNDNSQSQTHAHAQAQTQAQAH